MAKMIRAGILASLLLPAAALAQGAQGEIGYKQGALGYDALVSGQYAEAERQIHNAAQDGLDPAQMLNLGIIYLNTSRTADAQALFAKVATNREHFPIVLSNGDEVDSRVMGQRLLAKASARLASR